MSLEEPGSIDEISDNKEGQCDSKKGQGAQINPEQLLELGGEEVLGFFGHHLDCLADLGLPCTLKIPSLTEIFYTKLFPLSSPFNP